jgi:hypothetical protein
LDRVQRSPNGRYEAGKRRSTVDGGPDPRCSFCRPGKDAVKTCGHAASSRDKGTRMAGPKTPRPSPKQGPPMPVKRAEWAPGHAAARAQTPAFRFAPPGRGVRYDHRERIGHEVDMAGRDDVHLAGGCQCGRVRYELSDAPDHVM